MSQRHIIQVFEQYQNDRLKFVQTVAELCTRSQNIETLQHVGVLSFLKLLLLDTVPSIRQSAAEAVGKLASHSTDLANAMVKGGIVPLVIHSLAEQNAAVSVLRAVAKHSPELAQAMADCGALDALVNCLQELDPELKKAAAIALGCIAQHNSSLAQAVVDAGAVPQLILCIQEPEIALKRISATTLGDICKHSPELAQAAVDIGAIAHLAQLTLNTDTELKRHVFMALSEISKHSVDLAELVMETEIFPAVLVHLKDPDESVRRNVSKLLREITKHTSELSKMIVNAGSLAAVIDFLGDSRGNVRLPGIMMLGFVATHSENLAMAVIVSKGVPQLAVCLAEEKEDHIKAATAWALGQIGHHTPEHARAVAMCNVLSLLLRLYLDKKSSADLQFKAKTALKSILQKCTYLPALEPLLFEAPSSVLTHVVCQFSKVLPNDSKARKFFVTSGGLKKVLEIQAEPNSDLQESIKAIISCYPEEIIRYYSPKYLETLLERIDKYQHEMEPSSSPHDLLL